MDVITDPAVLAEVGEGQQIQVNSRAQGQQLWTKQAGLFVRDGVAVPVEFFHGYVNEGLVSRDVTDGPGVWYQSGHYDYLLLRSGNLVNLLVFYGGAFHQEVSNSRDWWARVVRTATRSDVTPDRVMSNSASMTLLMRHLIGMVQEVTPSPDKLETVTVWVTVSGVAPSRMPSRVGNRGIEWRFLYPYKAEVPPATCACGTLDRERVDPLLPRPLARGEWDAVATCRYDE